MTPLLRVTLLTILLAPAIRAADARPNVLLVLTDDQGYGDLRCQGNDRLDTPHLDRLAAGGARLTDFHVCPLCAPTRASVLTGRYHLRAGVTGVTHSREVMRADEHTLAEQLRAAGYATACIGKWHNGGYYPHTPAGQGFDRFVGFRGGHLNNFFDPPLERDGQPFRPAGFVTDALTDAAIDFVTAHRDRPWLCYVPFNAPHSPYQCPDDLFEKYRQRGFDEKVATVYAMIENLDANMGRLLAALAATGQADRTIVWFLGDNGPNTDRFNAGLRGRKGSPDEGGTRVPCLVRYPGRVPAGRVVGELAAHIDIVPTLRAWCGVTAAPANPLDGVSLVSLLDGTGDRLADRAVYFNQSRGTAYGLIAGAVRTRTHRLVLRGSGVELYDLTTDIGQKHNVAAKQTALADKLRAEYQAWFTDVTRGKPEPPAIPLGHAAAPVVELLAPDANLTGLKFRGQNGYANDWIGPWPGTDGVAAWELDAVRDGRYRVELLYCCAADDVGAEVRASVGANGVTGRIVAAHDPRPRPSPDRSPRGEVFEKDWQPLQLGELAVPRGRSRLEVRALTCPGKSAMELKAVRLTAVP